MNLFGIEKSTPEIIKHIPSHELPWGKDALLVWIPSGKSELKWIYGPEGEDTYYFLMLNEIPIVKRHSVNSCPTCEEIVLAGYGIDKVETSVIENLRICTSGKIDLSQPQVLDKLSPLLNLLKPGLYLLSVIPHCPSDGKGGFFWTSPVKPIYQKDCYWHEWRFPGPPTFLVPTQPLAKLDRATVEFYRKEIREGKRVGGIAYHIEGYMSALLDGHHRATAALYENTQIDCLTILGLSTIWETTRGSKIKNFGFHGYHLKTSELPKAIVDKTLKLFFEFDRIEARNVKKLKEMVSKGWSSEEKFTELEELSSKLPTIKTFEAIKILEELGEKHLMTYSMKVGAPISKIFTRSC
jgi:hypothetical protein